MTKRLMLTTLAVVLVVGFTACGGNGSNGPTPLPTPTPPTQAAVTFNVDPNPVVATAHPNNWYRFRVNLAFSESAGIGYTVDSVRARVSVTSTGQVALNDLKLPNSRAALQQQAPECPTNFAPIVRFYDLQSTTINLFHERKTASTPTFVTLCHRSSITNIVPN